MKYRALEFPIVFLYGIPSMISENWQTVLAVLTVLAAVGVLVRRGWCLFVGQPTTGSCGTGAGACQSCGQGAEPSSCESSVGFVELENLTSNRPSSPELNQTAR